jgi:hypothetical protein
MNSTDSKLKVVAIVRETSVSESIAEAAAAEHGFEPTLGDKVGKSSSSR